MVFASFIRKASDIEAVRSVLGEKGKHILIVSKVKSTVFYLHLKQFRSLFETTFTQSVFKATWNKSQSVFYTAWAQSVFQSVFKIGSVCIPNHVGSVCIHMQCYAIL